MPRLRTTRRAASLAGALVLPLAALAACGDESGGSAESSAGGGLEVVSVQGEPGKEPKVEWEGQLKPEETQTEVLVEGDGEEIQDGDSVLAHLWVGNGYSKQAVYSTYASGKPELFTVDGNLGAPFRAGLAGQTVGSRVAVATTAREAFGDMGNPQLGIGNRDGVLFVVDVVEKVASGPQGKEQEPAAWAPTLVEKDGVVTGFDFSGAAEPSGELRQTTLVEGDGPVVKKGQTIYVDYLGQVFEAKKPFDESYSGQPTSFQIGVGAVVKGWDQALVGQEVGSRVILEIPPELGYGKKGNEGAGIKGTDTLYFVVDILAAV